MIFPAAASPDYHDELVQPKRPSTSSAMMGGQISTIINSSVATAAEIAIFWYYREPASLDPLRAFWRQVGTEVSFSVPIEFWSDMPTDRRQRFIDLSPTGFWRFKEFTIEDFGPTEFRQQNAMAKLISVID